MPNTEKQEEAQNEAQKDYDKGQQFMQNENYSQAANAFHNALLGYQQENDENGVANASAKLGDICLNKKDFAKADEHYEKAYNICKKNTDRHSLFYLERKKAFTYHAWGKIDEAIKMYVDVIDEFMSLNDPKGTVETMETLADIYLEKNDKNKAADCYRTIASIHKNYKHNNFHDRFMKKADEIEAKANG